MYIIYCILLHNITGKKLYFLFRYSSITSLLLQVHLYQVITCVLEEFQEKK